MSTEPQTERPKRILCVCLGNICRSPTAEAILSDRLGPGFDVDSAGTGDAHVGAAPHPPATRAAEARGYGIGNLEARQIKPGDFAEFDLILAMDRQNLDDLKDAMPDGKDAELALFTQHLPGQPDVPDPFYTGGFEDVLDLIEEAAEAWALQLQARSADVPKAR